MRNPQGYGVLSDVDGTHEHDSFTCGHCNRIVLVKPRMDPAGLGGLCKQCMKLICPNCVTQGNCLPWERQLEKIEARARFLRSAGIS